MKGNTEKSKESGGSGQGKQPWGLAGMRNFAGIISRHAFVL